ncbi:MAG: sulfotransferase, partial [Planctomycetales bacterium]|nr:sulfotransferase [Planctomycetales bacterium]
YHRFYRLGVSQMQVDAVRESAESYRLFICGLYKAFATNEGKELAGEKTPDYVRCLPLLHALFPWCKSIHIVRDGRDTALSLLDWAGDTKGPARFELWSENPLAVAALWWRWQVRHGLAAENQLGPDRHLLVKYEKLVESPEAELRRISEFIGLPFADEMVRFNEGRVRNDSGISAKKAWLAPTSGLRDWRTQLDEPQQQLVEALAGDTLKRLDYPTRYGSFTPEAARQAEEIRNRWEENLARRHPAGGLPVE